MTIEELEQFEKDSRFEKLKKSDKYNLREYYKVLLIKYKDAKKYDEYFEICKLLIENKEDYCYIDDCKWKTYFFNSFNIINNCLEILKQYPSKENTEKRKEWFVLILKYGYHDCIKSLMQNFKGEILELLSEEEILKYQGENIEDNNNLLGNYYYLLSLQDDIAEDKQIELLKKSFSYNNIGAKTKLGLIYLQKAKNTENSYQERIKYCVKSLDCSNSQTIGVNKALNNIIPNLNLSPLSLQEHSDEELDIISNLQILVKKYKLYIVQKYFVQKYFDYDDDYIGKLPKEQINMLYNIIDNKIDLNKPNNDNINNINEIKFRLAISYIKYEDEYLDEKFTKQGKKILQELSNNGYTRATNYLNTNTEENNTKLEQIINFILQNNNNEFSIQAFLKKIILEGINCTDDNIVYLAERFNGMIDVETFVFMKEIYNKLIISDILLCKDETQIDNNINSIITINTTDNVYNNLTPKVIAIKHYLKNKSPNTTIEEIPLYNRIITTKNINDVDSLLQQYIELSKKNKKPYYIHFNNGGHSRFFIIQNGTFAYIDSIMYSGHTQQLFNISNRFGNCFLGSQNISIQSKLGCRIYTGLGMVISDEYIKKYGIENLEELGKQVEFSEEELEMLNDIMNSYFTTDELKYVLDDSNKFCNEYTKKIEYLINIRKELKKEEKPQLQELEEKVVKNIKTTLQNTINQEKQENEDNISLTEQSLLKLLQFIDPERKSIDIDKDFEEIILLLNRVDLVNNKVFSLTHLLFPLAQTMTLVNSYIDHNEKLKNADNRIKGIKDKVKVNHFVNDFREDILSRFNKIKELSKRIDEQKLQDMKFFKTPIDELPINEEKEEIEEEIEQKDGTTKEKQYPDFVSQNGNEYIVALLEAVISSREMFEKYTEKRHDTIQCENL